MQLSSIPLYSKVFSVQLGCHFHCCSEGNSGAQHKSKHLQPHSVVEEANTTTHKDKAIII